MANSEWKNELKKRTKQYANRIIRMYRALPRNQVAFVVGKQVLRSGTSVGAHYREACRARSAAELISKFGGLLMELDETKYWLELLVENDVVTAAKMQELLAETEELLAIFTKAILSAKNNRRDE